MLIKVTIWYQSLHLIISRGFQEQLLDQFSGPHSAEQRSACCMPFSANMALEYHHELYWSYVVVVGSVVAILLYKTFRYGLRPKDFPPGIKQSAPVQNDNCV